MLGFAPCGRLFALNKGVACALAFCLAAYGSSAMAGSTPMDTRFYYFFNGLTLGGRVFSVGDEDGWVVQLDGLKGQSKTGKVTASATQFQKPNDAIRIQTSSKQTLGQVALYGPPTNLGALKDMVELSFMVKVDRKPDADVLLMMDCSWPCRGEVSIGGVLRDLEKGQWTEVSTPLNCFTGKDFNLFKINGVFLLSTRARMDISVANIRLKKLAEGEAGCKSGEPPL